MPLDLTPAYLYPSLPSLPYPSFQVVVVCIVATSWYGLFLHPNLPSKVSPPRWLYHISHLTINNCIAILLQLMLPSFKCFIYFIRNNNFTLQHRFGW